MVDKTSWTKPLDLTGDVLGFEVSNGSLRILCSPSYARHSAQKIGANEIPGTAPRCVPKIFLLSVSSVYPSSAPVERVLK